ncbi:hypothetical protein [Anaerostipes sp. PC18]|uniref:hypothetical protein n=1 Tax=Anaerostipes sp. PC18 TaxID=3036926 RepID=UPI00308715A5|nr:hypothetical protein P8F77_02540 [Anaerostipes sp. PC18]
MKRLAKKSAIFRNRLGLATKNRWTIKDLWEIAENVFEEFIDSNKKFWTNSRLTKYEVSPDVLNRKKVERN